MSSNKSIVSHIHPNRRGNTATHLYKRGIEVDGGKPVIAGGSDSIRQ